MTHGHSYTTLRGFNRIELDPPPSTRNGGGPVYPFKSSSYLRRVQNLQQKQKRQIEMNKSQRQPLPFS